MSLKNTSKIEIQNSKADTLWTRLERHARVEAKDYLAFNQLSNLFQALLIGILFNKPADVLEFLQDCFKHLREMNLESVVWNTFVEVPHVVNYCPEGGEKEEEEEDQKRSTFLNNSDLVDYSKIQ